MEQFCGILCIINKLFVYAFCLYSVFHFMRFFHMNFSYLQFTCSKRKTFARPIWHSNISWFQIKPNEKLKWAKRFFTSNFMVITLTYTLIISFYWSNCSIAMHRLFQRMCNRHRNYDKSISSHFSLGPSSATYNLNQTNRIRFDLSDFLWFIELICL